MSIDEIFDKIGAQKGDVIINLNNKNFLLKIENNGDEKFSAHIYQPVYKIVDNSIKKKFEILWSSEEGFNENDEDKYYLNLSELIIYINELLKLIDEDQLK